MVVAGTRLDVVCRQLLLLQALKSRLCTTHAFALAGLMDDCIELSTFALAGLMDDCIELSTFALAGLMDDCIELSTFALAGLMDDCIELSTFGEDLTQGFRMAAELRQIQSTDFSSCDLTHVYQLMDQLMRRLPPAQAQHAVDDGARHLPQQEG
eukprot:gene35108-40854_t